MMCKGPKDRVSMGFRLSTGSGTELEGFREFGAQLASWS